MTTYQITSAAGMDMGTYEAETREAAIEAMRRDAGYESSQAAAEALGTTVEALDAELTVVEVARFEVQWRDDDMGTWQNPGCSSKEATFDTEEEAEAAIESLRRTGEWDDVEFRIVEAS